MVSCKYFSNQTKTKRWVIKFLFSLILFILYQFSIYCQYVIPPYYNDFSAGLGPHMADIENRTEITYENEDSTNFVLEYSESANTVGGGLTHLRLYLNLGTTPTPIVYFRFRETKNSYPTAVDVNISVDGTTFVPIDKLYFTDGDWEHHMYNLKLIADQLGITLNNHVVFEIELYPGNNDNPFKNYLQLDDLKVYNDNNALRFTPYTYATPRIPRPIKRHLCDYDNDGDLDSVSVQGILYKKTGAFQPVNSGIDPLSNGGTWWADINDDNLYDLLITGTKNGNAYTNIYLNAKDDHFDPLEIPLRGSNLKPAFCDLNNDGKKDIISALTQTENINARIYRNNYPEFEKTNSIFTYPDQTDIIPGDIDSDGDLDIIIPPHGIFINCIDSFIHYHFINSISFDGVDDYDNDGNLDIYDGNVVYYNQSSLENLNPTYPLLQSVITKGNEVLFDWSDGNDDTTPQVSLTYNLRVGTTSGSNNVVNSYTDVSGKRLWFQEGNCGHSKSRKLLLNPGTYYWNIQTVDNQYRNSSFSPTLVFNIPQPFTNISLSDGDQRSAVGIADFNADGKLDFTFTDGMIDNKAGELPNYVKMVYNYSPFFDIDTIFGINLQKRGYITLFDLDNSNNPATVYSGYADKYVSSMMPLEKEIYNSPLFGKIFGPGASGDLDNDGDQDLIFTLGGNFASLFSTRIYYNNNDTLAEDASNTLPDLFDGMDAENYTSNSSISIIDYDNDSDNDIFLCGIDKNNQIITQLYTNNSGVFSSSHINFKQLYKCATSWGDYDNDGDLDLLISGKDEINNEFTMIYKNNPDHSFTPLDFILEDCGTVGWGDYNNDGLLDFFAKNFLYRNLGNDNFELLYNNVTGAVKWVDYDDDGDLDIFAFNSSSVLLRNNYNYANTAPEAPYNLLFTPDNFKVYLSWDEAADTESVYGGLYYNIRVGVTPYGSEIVSPFSDIVSGKLKTPYFGNVGTNKSWMLKNLPLGKYYWSVQAIDQSFLGGAWSVIDSFIINDVSPGFSFVSPVCSGNNVHFTDKSVSTDIINAWKWNFGDGYSSTLQNPSHIYETADTLNVTLWAFSQSGDSSNYTQQIIIKPKPIANFTVEPVCLGNTSHFINNSDISGIEVSSWLWDFGDDFASSAPGNVTHIYTHSETATLKITATNGCYDIVSREVYIGETPHIILTSGTLPMCPSDSAELAIDNYSDIYDYQWRLNNVDITGAKGPVISGNLNNGNYKVVASIGDCNVTSNEYPVTLKSAPDKPVVFVNDGPDFYYMSCSNTAASVYRWYYNDELINYATKFYCVAGQKLGKYYVEIEETGKECTIKSDVVTVPKGLNDIATDSEGKFNIFPNPNDGAFTIVLNNENQVVNRIEIYNTAGKTEYIQAINSNQKTISINSQGLNQGLYLIKIYTGNEILTGRIGIF